MASETTVIEEGIDRLQKAVASMGEELDSFQSRLAERQETIVADARKRVETLREEIQFDNLTERAGKFQQQFEKDLRGNPYVKRAQKARKEFERDLAANEWVQRGLELRREAGEQFDQRVDEVLGSFQIARAADVRKLERKISRLNKKLRELEKGQAETNAVGTHPTVQ